MKKATEIREKSLTEGKANFSTGNNSISIDGVDKKYGEQIARYVLHAIKNTEQMKPFLDKSIEVSIKIK